MSLEAITWAFRQEVPGTAKLVLLALANRADDETGECWPGMPRIAKDAFCSVRSAQMHIAALRRNGYVDVRPMYSSGDGRQRSNHYWLLFDRQPAAWQSKPGDPQDIADDGADSASHTNTTDDLETDSETKPIAPPPVQPAAPPCIEPSGFEPSTTEQVEIGGAAHCAPSIAPQPSAPPQRPKAATEGSKPKGFDPKARHREIARQEAAEETRRRTNRIFVFEGSDGWESWRKLKRAVDGSGLMFAVWSEAEQRKGAHFCSLFPPRLEEVAGLPWQKIVAGERAKSSGDRRGECPGHQSPESSESFNDLANELNGTGR